MLTDVSGQRDVSYQLEGQPAPESHTKIWKASHSSNLMVAMRTSAGRKTGLHIMSETVRVNPAFCIDHILKQIVEKDITLLYPGEKHKVTLQIDSAGSHVCSGTTAWMKSRVVKCIPKQKWRSNSLDLFPMDFGINSIFKNLLSEKTASTLDGIKRVVK